MLVEAGERLRVDEKLLAEIDESLEREGEQIERVELRAALRTAMESAARINAYLNSTEPWKLRKSDPQRTATVLVTALEAIAGVRVGFAPYLPFSTLRLDHVFGPVRGWTRPRLRAGLSIPKPSPLFAKVDLAGWDLETAAEVG